VPKCLDDHVAKEKPVEMVDVFVDEPDLGTWVCRGLNGVSWGAYVGGYDVHTAMRRVDADAPFGDWRCHPHESK
jgi:hypothetical protein